MDRLALIANRSFFLWVILTAVLAYVRPDLFLWVGYSVKVHGLGSVNGIILGLGLIMFGMGMTLSWDRCVRAMSHPGWIVLGVVAQYGLMPLIAFLLSLSFGLNEWLAAGVILVGCCPGGTASNVIAFLADADVPLSVSVTLTSTLLAPILTPFLFWLYAQEFLGFFRETTVDVPIGLLVRGIVIIVIPILLGLAIKRFAWGTEPVPTIKQGFTLLSVVVIALIVGFILASAVRNETLSWSFVLILPVVLHNLLGLGAGFGLASVFSIPLDSIRSISIEVGMQNSGLAVALVSLIVERLEHGDLNGSIMALPAVLFSVWHNISGPILASWWGRSSR